ncbi:MAG: hypothetical protein A2Z98_12505 [Spirochaetes bacterium GWB1_27_13]|nr:MAG: hypothetical protein A2Z98_12505 [Spirochaetes bacterium GWB1_27_13]
MAKVTKNQYKKTTETILEKLLNEVSCFPKDQNQKERKEKSKKDLFEFIKNYLPHYAEQGTPDFHREINQIYENMATLTAAAIAAPRGFAKSTIFFAKILQSICFKLEDFVVYVSATRELAQDFTEFLKLELEHNERIKEDFGNLLTHSGKKNDFVANNVRVVARAKRQMVRGFKYKNHRPSLIVVDDIEKDEEAQSPKLVLKYLKIITEGVFPSLNPINGKLIIIGTIIKKRSVLGIIINSDEEIFASWTKRKYQALNIDDNGNQYSLWEARFPVKTLLKIKATIGTAAFEKEYQNNPKDEDDESVFHESWIQYYENVDLKKLVRVMFIDPSAKEKTSARNRKPDYKAIIVLGLDRKEMKYYVLYAWIQRTSIINMIAAIFRLFLQFRCSIVGVESNGFQSLLEPLIRAEEKQKKINLPLKLQENYKNKEIRIKSLAPTFERLLVFFKKYPDDDTKLLINQFIYYPGIEDDGPDAFKAAKEIIDKLTIKNSFLGINTKQIPSSEDWKNL